MIMMKRAVPGLWCALACGTSAADPVEEYKRACEVPHYEVLSVMTHPGDLRPIDWDAAAKPCRALIQRLEAETDASDEARLALFLAKEWLGDYPDKEGRCTEIGQIVEGLPGNADALFEWSYCIDDDDAHMALLKKLVEMGHPGARARLVFMFEHSGDYYGIPPETLAGYAEGFYENAQDVSQRYRAAQAIYKMALDTGDSDAAEAIQNRLIHDHGLDALDYSPSSRNESLGRACAVHMFAMDLEQELCIASLAALAAEASLAGEAIPPGVLLHMADAFEHFEYGTWSNGPKPQGAARLAAILDAHPEPLRSSEHLRVLAKTAAGWAERVVGLRRALEADPGNLRARCDLADALAFTGALDEAASLYKGLMAAEHPPCRAGDALGRLANRTAGETMEMVTVGP
ncbi:MAG: tetratricopeptide repeat protein [Gammaproteobacteria bacterium]|nr:hypothetical protein [Gammaproteobacteria bacterium]MYK46063.1 tetratricopeptide repeat protein [Gammaproteobacteria bacterium]